MHLRHKRRLLSFSVRTLVAVTLFCVWLGWQASIVREGKACLNWILVNNHQYAEPLPRSSPAYLLSWHRRMLGDSGLFLLTLRPAITVADLKRLQRAFREANVIWKRPAKPTPPRNTPSADSAQRKSTVTAPSMIHIGCYCSSPVPQGRAASESRLPFSTPPLHF